MIKQTYYSIKQYLYYNTKYMDLYWSCFICNYKNIPIKKHNNKGRYCKRCKQLDILSFAKDNSRKISLIIKYNNINKVLNNIPISNTKIPYYYITFNIINNCNNILYPNKYSIYNLLFSQELFIIDYIKLRLYYKSINKWERYHKNVSHKRYKRLLKKRFSKILPKRPLCIFMSYF